MFGAVTLDEAYPRAGNCLGVTLLTALYWVFEPIPIVITSFFPVFLMPLLKISKASVVANTMFSDTSMVFLGGFLFSTVMVKWNLHSRIALKTVLIFGLKPWLLLLGIMLVTTFLGMWISNTATALTMIPNALAIITKLEEITGDSAMVDPFAKCLFLAIAYSCSVGGFITLIGTPPNLILSQIARERFPKAKEIGFTEFMFVSLPISLSILVIMYFYFLIVFIRKVKIPPGVDESAFRENYNKLGKMKPAEIIIVLLFILLACLWLFRSDLSFGSNANLTGWANTLYPGEGTNYIADGTVAILLSMLFFIIHVPEPTEKEERAMQESEINLEIKPQTKQHQSSSDEEETEDSELREEASEANIIDGTEDNMTLEQANPQKTGRKWIPLLEWNYAQEKIPWTILFLFSGGFVLNQGFKDSGMDTWLGNVMKGLANLPLFVLLLAILCVTAVISTVASNTACANILIPIMAVFAQQSQKYHPWMLMFPVCFMTSCCFLLPVSTPPNLIAYGYGRLKMSDFLLHGAFVTVVAIFVIIGLSMAIIPAVFDAEQFPEWALPENTTTTA
ncbi:Sodium:sulfate symporter transmembrane region family protein [Histomonas meleagridis]|uniref:Sodium:sulfate symporter transmembrane region family protein n=1 Tax=Histomonas meleagridis TaxID=135588 RepID=UPI003559EAAD|nr:Sodium:sulfate symporter transmembrane region family protein [Histomonas meleagridis]KAH0805613.1 Sodium:sulfate symporter transmembrane region family protein [Histomonas meleagridis]